MARKLPFRAEASTFTGTRDFSDVEQAREWLRARGGGRISRRANYRPGHDGNKWEFVEECGAEIASAVQAYG